MEIILDELRRNGVDMDKETLTYHIYYIIEHHGWLYEEQMTVRVGVEDSATIFNEMNVNGFGRAMAYLALVHVMHKATRLVVAPLKNIDFTDFKVERNFFHRVLSYLKNVFKRDELKML